MKSTLTGIAAIVLLFSIIACNNDKEEKKTTPIESTSSAKEKEKTEISVGPDGGEVKTKDVDLKIVTKDTSK